MINIIKVSHMMLGDDMLGVFDIIREVKEALPVGTVPEKRS